MDITLFEDQECTIPATELDFGRVTLGKQHEKVLYMKNEDEKWPLVNIDVNQSDESLKIEFAQVLRPNSVQPVKFTVLGKLSRSESLDAAHLFTAERWIG